MHVKFSNFDCPWTDDDDAKLLKGIYEYGIGSWDAIKMDSHLGLDKVCTASIAVTSSTEILDQDHFTSCCFDC